MEGLNGGITQKQTIKKAIKSYYKKNITCSNWNNIRIKNLCIK